MTTNIFCYLTTLTLITPSIAASSSTTDSGADLSMSKREYAKSPLDWLDIEEILIPAAPSTVVILLITAGTFLWHAATLPSV